jgi:hypothetical protein
MKLATCLGGLIMLAASFVPAAKAQSFGPQDGGGIWYFTLTIAGQPACQCIEITKFNADGTLVGPANDHFSGDEYGVWTRTAYHQIAVALVQNTINADGTAGGVYLVKFKLTLNETGDHGSGSGTVALIDNTGASTYDGTFTLTGVQLKAP